MSTIGRPAAVAGRPKAALQMNTQKPSLSHAACSMPSVQRAGGAPACDFQDMGIDHRRTHVRVPQQLLHRENVDARLRQVRGEAVAQGVH